MIIFGTVEVILSQFPSLEKITVISVVAAVMSFAYSLIGLLMCIAKFASHHAIRGTVLGVKVGADGVSASTKTWHALQALGNIAFAYTYAMLLIEIQVLCIFNQYFQNLCPVVFSIALESFVQIDSSLQNKLDFFLKRIKQIGIACSYILHPNFSLMLQGYTEITTSREPDNEESYPLWNRCYNNLLYIYRLHRLCSFWKRCSREYPHRIQGTILARRYS